MMERPAPVRRVTPPSTIITSTMKATVNNQVATIRRLRRPAARSSGGAPGKSRTSKGMAHSIGVCAARGYCGGTPAASVQPKIGARAAIRCRLDQAGSGDAHGVHLAIQLTAPEIEEFVQH